MLNVNIFADYNKYKMFTGIEKLNMYMKKFFKKYISFIFYVLFIIIVSFLIITFIAQRTCVDGHSMENILYPGDNVILDKISYRFNNPERFDIIVFPHEVGLEKKYYIKRIIGLPGETVYINETGNIYINDVPLSEEYGKEDIQDAGIASLPITLDADEYFVLGDNRNNSSDSRDPSVGLIKRNEIIGKAFIRIYPFSKFGIIS